MIEGNFQWKVPLEKKTTLTIREVMLPVIWFEQALNHPLANLFSFLVFARTPTAVRTLYRHEIGYMKRQIGNGRFEEHLAQLH